MKSLLHINPSQTCALNTQNTDDLLSIISNGWLTVNTWLKVKNTNCNGKFNLSTVSKTLTSTHLHDAAQVPDVHALCLNDLHDNTVHIGQLWVGRHGVRDDRRGRDVRYFVTCLPVGGGVVVVPLVADHPYRLQPFLPAAPGACKGGTLVPCPLSSALGWAQLQVYVLLTLYGWGGGGRKGYGAPKKAAAIAG